MWITNKENCYFSCYRRISRDTFVLTLWAKAQILEAKIGSSQWENVEHKRKRNKNQEGKSENHFICDLIVLSKKLHFLYCISALIILKRSISFASHSAWFCLNVSVNVLLASTLGVKNFEMILLHWAHKR